MQTIKVDPVAYWTFPGERGPCDSDTTGQDYSLPEDSCPLAGQGVLQSYLYTQLQGGLRWTKQTQQEESKVQPDPPGFWIAFFLFLVLLASWLNLNFLLLCPMCRANVARASCPLSSYSVLQQTLKTPSPSPPSRWILCQLHLSMYDKYQLRLI